MKVLMLSTDENILREGSEARRRMEEYGALFSELHIVVLARQNYQLPRPPSQAWAWLRRCGRAITPPAMQGQALRAGNYQKEGNLFVHPTNSRNKLVALWGAYKIGKKILKDNQVIDPSIRWDDRVAHNWVITAQDAFEIGLVSCLLKKKFVVPLQLQVHTDFLSSYFWRESLKNKIRVILAKWLLPRADGVRVVSERIRHGIITNYHLPITKVSTLPIFVDTAKIHDAAIKTDLHKKYPQFETIVLMASRLTREKNIGLAISAMGEIVKKYPKTGLVVVGSGPERSFLNLQPTTYNLQANVVFEDWSDDLASYYKTADIFLLTSNYEGYGRTAIEAMAGGCVVVMTDVGLAGDIIKHGENGLVFPVGDKIALVNVLADLIVDGQKRRALGDEAREGVAKLMKKEEYLKRYGELLEEITND